MSTDVAAAFSGVNHVPGAGKPDPILTVDGVRRSFGGLVAVDVDRLEIQRGAITALIGPNGAGKTTLFNVLSGFDQATSGTWTFDGRDVTGLPAYRTARRGMVRTFQLTKALGLMTVLDNMKLAAQHQRGERFLPALWPPAYRHEEQAVEERALELLELVGLLPLKDDLAATLSGGQRKLLELTRALMVEPALVMLDEPTAGVNPVLTQALLAHITGIRDAGRTVVFVEHDMDVVSTISDWVICMAEGRVIAEGPPRVVGSDPAVINAYLGRRRRGGGTPRDGRSGSP